jgi:hypothetical protein
MTDIESSTEDQQKLQDERLSIMGNKLGGTSVACRPRGITLVVGLLFRDGEVMIELL